MAIRLAMITCTILLLAIIPVQSQSKSVLGGEIVPTEVYEAALPYINDERVTLRDYPSLEYGDVKLILNRDMPINVIFVTIEKETIEGTAYPWYHVNLRSGLRQSGWVFGKYLSFRPDYMEAFWGPRSISLRQLARSRFAKIVLDQYLHAKDYSAPADWIDGKKPVKTEEPGIWYLKAYALQTYVTDYGKVLLLYKEGESMLPVVSIEIVAPNTKLPISVGDNLEKLKSVFGDDYDFENGIVSFRLFEEFDLYQFRFEFKNNSIVSIRAWRQFD